MAFLDKLKKKSICPVKETVRDIDYFTGWFIHLSTTSFDGRIEINKEMKISEKEGTLAHEMGHAKCLNRACKCYEKTDRPLQEVHAELYALHLLLKNRRKNAIKARFKRLKNDWNDSPYSKAKDVIIHRKVYKRCQEFTKKDD